MDHNHNDYSMYNNRTYRSS